MYGTCSAVDKKFHVEGVEVNEYPDMLMKFYFKSVT